MNKQLRIANIIIALCGLSVPVGFGIIMALASIRNEKSIVPATPALLIILAWACLPSYVLATVADWIKKSKNGGWIMLIGALSSTLFSSYVYLEAFYIHPAAQSGLIFIFFPFYHLIGASIISGISLLTLISRR
jgi:drug/metabolite transporter (DMT)-like permease